MDVVSRFFEHEVNEYVCETLLRAIETRERALFTFNVFDVEFRWSEETAVVQDVLDPATEESVDLVDFAARLRMART